MKIFILSAVALSSTALLAGPTNTRIIYGDDNRVEIFEISKDLQDIAASTAGMIKKSKMLNANKDHKLLPPETIEKSMRLCEDEKFVDQSNAMICSGFLVGPDLLVTAGHCVNTEKDCSDVAFVFDYKLREDSKRADVVIPNENIFTCKKVLDAKLYNSEDRSIRNDYALIRLDRKVEGRKFLNFRTSGKVADGEDLYVIGHPSGLPSKFAGDASVKFNTHESFFVSDLDTFGGNSGSAVFNAKTNTVEGILVRGAVDYVRDPKGCIVANKVAKDAPVTNPLRFGEAVSRITDIPTLSNRGLYYSAIAKGTIDEVKELSKKIAEINIYDNSLNTALHYAALNKRLDVAEFLLSEENRKDVNPNLVNDRGQTALYIAAEKNDLKLIRYLLDNGASASIKDAYGIYPYQKAPRLSKARRLLKRSTTF